MCDAIKVLYYVKSTNMFSDNSMCLWPEMREVHLLLAPLL